MSKKNFKRSMTLGALMAFVITGTAFAAMPTDVTEATLDTSNNRYYGVRLQTGTEDATIGEASYVVNVQKQSDLTNGGVFAFQLDSNGTKLTFTEDATFSASTNTTGTGNNQLTALSVYDGQVTVNGNVTATANATGEYGKSAYGISLIGGEGCDPIVNLNGESVNVTVTTETAREGRPIGTSLDYCETIGIAVAEGTLNTGANTNTTIKVTGDKAKVTDGSCDWETPSPLYGIKVEAAQTNFGGKTTVNVTSNTEMSEVVGINAINGYYTSTQSGENDSSVTLNDVDITIVNNGEYGAGYGLIAENFYANESNYESIINVKGNLKVDVTACDAYGIDVYDGQKAILGSEKTEYITFNINGKEDTSVLYATDEGTQIDITTKNLIINATCEGEYPAGSIQTNEGAIINVTADKASIGGIMYAGKDATLNLANVKELTLTGLENNNAIPAIQVNDGGTLKVNTEGTIAIEGAEAGNSYNVVAGNITKENLWANKNIAYDRMEMFAVAEMGTTEINEDEEVDLYKITYKAFEDLTEEELAEAKAQMVSATGGEAVAAGKLVASAIGADLTSAPGAKELLGAITSSTTMTTEAKAEAINAATKLAEASGNTSTVVNVANSISGATTGRLSFNGGNEGGYGPDLYDSQDGSVSAVWAQYVHGKDKATDMPSTAGTSSYESNYNGFVLGVDFKEVGKYRSGIAFNYGEGDANGFSTGGNSKSDYDFWGVGYYGNIRNEDTNVIFDVNYAKSDSEVAQNNIATAGSIEANPKTTTWTAGVKVEKLYQNDSVQVVPYTGIRYMSVDTEEYTSKLDGKTLFSYAPERQDIWMLPLGVSIKQEITNNNGWTVTPKVDLSYVWAFGDTDSNMELTIPGIEGSNDNIGYTVMDDGSFLGLVGIEASKDNWTFGVSYSYQKGDYAESKKWYVDAKYSF